jgi:hypothetical protein
MRSHRQLRIFVLPMKRTESMTLGSAQIGRNFSFEYAELPKQTVAAQRLASISLAICLGKAPAGSSPVKAITGTGG